MVSHSFSGNKAFFEIVMMAYNLFNVFKEEALGQITQKQTAQTIRDRILRIPGKLVTSARQPIINSRRTGRIDANTNKRSQRSSENQRRWPNLNDKGQVSSRPAKRQNNTLKTPTRPLVTHNHGLREDQMSNRPSRLPKPSLNLRA